VPGVVVVASGSAVVRQPSGIESREQSERAPPAAAAAMSDVLSPEVLVLECTWRHHNRASGLGCCLFLSTSWIHRPEEAGPAPLNTTGFTAQGRYGEAMRGA
jgi:hypothetical protein